MLCSHSLCEEFYFSEQRYCRDMKQTLTTYRDQLLRRFDPNAIQNIFANIPELIQLSDKLLEGMDTQVKAKQREEEAEALASLFLSLHEPFQTVSKYIGNLRTALKELANLEQNNELSYCMEVVFGRVFHSRTFKMELKCEDYPLKRVSFFLLKSFSFVLSTLAYCIL